MTRPLSVPLSTERLRAAWADLNARYFRAALPPIAIVWSRRLTASAALFTSLAGPRTPAPAQPAEAFTRRTIRLSLPLLRDQSEREILATLAHEMIHQWQFDVLKRRPNHGPDFRRKMAELNRDGWGITISHTLDEAVQALAKYKWRCRQCGLLYQRQRRTIRPRRHRCGTCMGSLVEISSLQENPSVPHRNELTPPDLTPQVPPRPGRRKSSAGPVVQLNLNFSAL